MKRTYTTPLAEVVRIGAVEMICQSIDLPIKGEDFDSGLTITDNDDVFSNVFEGLW